MMQANWRYCTCIFLTVAAVSAAVAQPRFPFVENFGLESQSDWTVMAGDWTFTDAGAVQSSNEYDCGLGIEVQPEGAYYLSVRFEPTGEFNGAGLFFALPQADKKHGGMMVRCDPGGRVMWGWFDGAGGFQYFGDAECADVTAEQELAVAVDPDKLAFNIFHNGQRVASDISTFHAAGYIGVQTSGGPHRIERVELRPAKPDELSGLTAPGKYSRIVDLVGDDQRVVALRRAPDFLVSYDRRGERTAAASSRSLPDAPDTLAPVAVCWQRAWQGNTRQGLLVLAEGGSAIYTLDAELKPVGEGPLVRLAEMTGQDIATDRAGYIFVADPTVPGLHVFSPTGEKVLTYGEKGNIASYNDPSPLSDAQFNQPQGVAVDPEGRIIITDRSNYTFVVYRYDASENELLWETNGPWLPYPAGIDILPDGQLLLAGTYEFYRSYGAIRILDLAGFAERSFVGHALNSMSDKIRACYGPGDRLYIADPDKDRILVLPRRFEEKMPEFEWLESGGIKLTMTKVDGTTTTTVNSKRSAEEDGRVAVEQQDPVCTVWPPATADDLTTYYLPPKPPDGQMYVIDMPVVVAVPTRLRDNEGKLIEIDGDGIAPRLARELEVDRDFYYRCSHGLLNKQFEIMIIDEAVAELDGGWVSPGAGRRFVNEVRRQRGLPELERSDSLVVIHTAKGYAPDGWESPGYVGGGGLTLFGYSGYALYNHGQGWLMGHEWGHQLDSYFDRSGMPDWWLNHPDGTVHVGRYGEHWDCNAFLCRRVDRMNWLRFRFGNLRLTADADGDKLADDDAALPLDERRFGSSTEMTDTDNDGLSDLRELMAANFTSADPTDPDTDGDGMRDARDPHPTHAVAGKIEMRMAELARYVPGLTKLGSIERAWCDVDLYGAYEADFVHVSFVLNKPVHTLEAAIDFQDNGWFVGRDNVMTSCHLNWKDDTVEIGRTHGCQAELDTSGDRPVVHLTIPRPAARAPLDPGSAISVALRVRHGAGAIAFLVEPWELQRLELE